MDVLPSRRRIMAETGICVLVVDGDEEVLEILVGSLQHGGFDTVRAIRPTQGLRDAPR
jgi:hypothetical protein